MPTRPFGTSWSGSRSSGILASEGVLVVGHARDVTLPETAGGLTRVRLKVFGGSAVSLYRPAAAADAQAGAEPWAPATEE